MAIGTTTIILVCDDGDGTDVLTKAAAGSCVETICAENHQPETPCVHVHYGPAAPGSGRCEDAEIAYVYQDGGDYKVDLLDCCCAAIEQCDQCGYGDDCAPEQYGFYREYTQPPNLLYRQTASVTKTPNICCWTGLGEIVTEIWNTVTEEWDVDSVSGVYFQLWWTGVTWELGTYNVIGGVSDCVDGSDLDGSTAITDFDCDGGEFAVGPISWIITTTWT